MYRFTIYLLISLIIYSCAPINKKHGYMIEDILQAMDKVNNDDPKESHKNDILEAFGSPSIKITDIDDVWIYLVSVKQENVFDEDQINLQQILRYQFDSDGNVIKFNILDQNNFSKIAFSNEKTTITRDAYGITDQIYDAFTKGTTQ